ncbi:MAG: lipoxygenase family protein [Acidobacteriota bacterium]
MFEAPSLPRDDRDPGGRHRQLAKARDDYRFTPPDASFALLQDLPRQERFPKRYRLNRLRTGGRFLANLAVVELKRFLRPKRGLERFAEYFPLLNRPRAIDRFRSDGFFGNQRLAGANALDLRLVTEPLADFPLTDAQLSLATGLRLRIDEEIAEHRLYVLDHSRYQPLVDRLEERREGRYLVAPRALYRLSPAAPGLMPVAIQLRKPVDRDEPVFLRDGSDEWLMAKLLTHAADTTSLELRHHLAQTHLLLEGVIVAAHRTLAQRHPVLRLLEEHFEETLAINDFGKDTLINPGGFLDQLMPGDLEETMELVSEAISDYRLDRGGLPDDLRSRGLDIEDRLPNFPYAEDGLLVWSEIERFVRHYLSLYYSSDAELAEDAEIARWLEAMSGPGRLRGVPSSVTARDELARLLTHVIWIAGPRHCAVNYPQWDYIAHVPNMSFSLYAPAPRALGTHDTEQSLMRLLPDHRQTLKQVLLMQALSGWQHTRLGHYSTRVTEDLRAAELVVAFQGRLADVERAIEDRNVARSEPYEYLLPSRIPNSANI